MAQGIEIAVLCRISAGGFSGERIAEITKADGTKQKVSALRHYCWKADRSLLAPDEPRSGQTVEGLVAARRLKDLPNGQVVVNTPDGEIFAVPSTTVTNRPAVSEITSNVSVG